MATLAMPAAAAPVSAYEASATIPPPIIRMLRGWIVVMAKMRCTRAATSGLNRSFEATIAAGIAVGPSKDALANGATINTANDAAVAARGMLACPAMIR